MNKELRNSRDMNDGFCAGWGGHNVKVDKKGSLLKLEEKKVN